MKTIVSIIFSLLITGACSGQQASEIRFKGFVDSYHAARIENPNDFMASRSRFRLEFEKINGNTYFFASVNAIHNNALKDLSGIQFREAYMEYTGKNWGFKAGRQIIIWGKADGLKITDVISPMDLTEFLAQDYDDIRMPVNSIEISRYSNNWNLDLICVPVFESYILPGSNNPWGFNFAESGLIEDEADSPEFKLSNMEYGGKLSFYLSGIDFDLSALNTWNKMPVYSYYLSDNDGSMHIKPEHHRLGFVGFCFSKSLSTFIIRGEGAFYIDKKFSPIPEYFEEGLYESNSVNYLVGVDWYPGQEWTLTGQLSDEYIMKYETGYAQEEHTYISTLGVSKKTLRSTLTLSAFGYLGLNEGDLFSRASADYALSDDIHLTVGFDWFHGDSGTFGRYNKNSQLWIKAKYSF